MTIPQDGPKKRYKCYKECAGRVTFVNVKPLLKDDDQSRPTEWLNAILGNHVTSVKSTV